MGFNRRDFIKFAAGAGAGVALTPLPWKLVDDVSIWSQNWSWIPANPKGETSYALTTSKLCPSACGLKVRLVGGRPVRALSRPDHPLGGGLSALAAAETQLLYSPARVKTPLRREPGGKFKEIGWEEAEKLLLERVAEAADLIAAVSGDENGSSLELLSALLRGRGSSNLFVMPSDAQAAGRAWQLMGGSGQPGYKLEESDFILAVGANVLESWGPFIRNRRIFASKRPHGAEPEAGFIYAGPMQNHSAAVADQWLPLKPGSELVFLLGLASLLTQRGLSANAGDFVEFRAMLERFDPQVVYALTSVTPQAMQDVAAALLRASKPLVLSGSEGGQGGGALQVVAGLALNLLLGGDSLCAVPLAPPILTGAEDRSAIQARDLPSYLSKELPLKAIIFHEANPVYALPGQVGAARAIQSVPFKVSLTPFMDETALLCDLVLPSALGLERLDDIESPYGCARPFYALSRKLAEPPAGVRPAADVLLALSARLGRKLAPSYQALLQAKAKALGAAYAALEKGEVFEGAARRPGGLKFLPELLRLETENKTAAGPALLAPLRKSALGTEQTGIPPFNVKTIRGNELSGGEMHVLLNGATAYSRGLHDGDRVRLSAGGNSLTARVRVFEGIVPDALGVLMGLGHTALDAFSRNKGANIAELFTAAPETGTGLTLWNSSGVDIVRI